MSQIPDGIGPEIALSQTDRMVMGGLIPVNVRKRATDAVVVDIRHFNTAEKGGVGIQESEARHQNLIVVDFAIEIVVCKIRTWSASASIISTDSVSLLSSRKTSLNCCSSVNDGRDPVKSCLRSMRNRGT